MLAHCNILVSSQKFIAHCLLAKCPQQMSAFAVISGNKAYKINSDDYICGCLVVIWPFAKFIWPLVIALLNLKTTVITSFRTEMK